MTNIITLRRFFFLVLFLVWCVAVWGYYHRSLFQDPAGVEFVVGGFFWFFLGAILCIILFWDSSIKNKISLFLLFFIMYVMISGDVRKEYKHRTKEFVYNFFLWGAHGEFPENADIRFSDYLSEETFFQCVSREYHLRYLDYFFGEWEYYIEFPSGLDVFMLVRETSPGQWRVILGRDNYY